MKDTILHKLLKWIVASSVSLLALPISVFIIIFSLYPDLIDVGDFDISKLRSYYNLCDAAIQDSTFIRDHPDTLYRNGISKNHKNKHHLLVIDQTLSTIFKDIELGSLGKDLIKSIRESGKSQIDTTSIKELIYIKLIDAFKFDNNCDSLSVFFYNGDKNQSEASWVECNKEAYSTELLKHLHATDIKPDQETDLKKLLSIVQEKIEQTKSLECITFFSDFYHEPEKDLVDADFTKFKSISKERKINLIALWKTKYGENERKREARQNNFIDRFKKYFEGVVATEIIRIDKYSNNSYTGYGDFLEFEEIITFKSLPGEMNDNDSMSISLFAPASDPLKYNEAVVKLKLDSLGKFRWKIKSIFDNNKTFVKFEKNCDAENKNKYVLNQWYEEECDSLWLSIKLDHDCNFDDLKFCYVINDNGVNRFEECDIEIKNIFFSKTYKENLTRILNAFCVLLIICIIAGELLFILYFHEDKKDLNKNRIMTVIGIIALTFLLGLLFYFVHGVHYCLPRALLFIIALIITGKIICIGLLLIRKKDMVKLKKGIEGRKNKISNYIKKMVLLTKK
jgi:hypothetical protein